MPGTPPTHHTLSTPDPSRWLPLDAIGTVVTREGKAYRMLAMYFGADPESHDGTLHQYYIAEEVNPQDIRRWYLVRTKRGREAVTERALEAAGITVLLPRLYFQAPRERKMRRGRPKDTVPAGGRVQPLFPGYLFAQLAPGDAESWNRLRGHRASKRWWGWDPSPFPCPMRSSTPSWSGRRGRG